MFQSLGSPTMAASSGNGGMVNYRKWGRERISANGNKYNVLTNILRREILGISMHRLKNPFGDNGTPERLRMPIEDIIPPAALEAGNIFMGFTNCGRYILSYTCRPNEHFGAASVFDSDANYIYTLHFWLFTPYGRVRKVSQLCLFDNNGVYDNNLLIEISQWGADDSHLLITGHSENPDTECHHTFYTTIVTIPDTKNCPNCVYMHDDEIEDDLMANSRLRANCILHGLTLHMKYDHVTPYPKLNADVQLRFRNTVLLNTGNLIHMVTYRLIQPTNTVRPDVLVVPAASSAISTSRVPLRCDIWLKITNANMAALSSLKSNSHKHDNVSSRQENAISLNFLDSLLTCFPTSATSKPHTSLTSDVPDRTHRRLSQSSVDFDFAMFSPKGYDHGPMSPPFLNRPRSPRRGEAPYTSEMLSKSTAASPSKLMLPPQERKFFKRRLSSQSLSSNSVPPSGSVQSPTKTIEDLTPPDPTSNKQMQPNESAFDVFEMRLEDTAVERHLYSFKSFRKRRLADKKYEFSDADLSAENIIPLKMTRRKSRYSQLQGSTIFSNSRSENENSSAGNESPRAYAEGTYAHPRSPRSHLIMSPMMSPNYINESFVSDVLRPLNHNPKVKVAALSPNNALNGTDGNDVGKIKDEELTKDYTNLLLRNECHKKCEEKFEEGDNSSHPHVRPTVSVNINCIAKVLRSYIQKEDDNTSVITDIEDEMCQGYPFPVALPLEVHGAGYQQLQMISNSKADKVQVPVVQVLQRTLDIEMLCNEVANLICVALDKHYCSCIDFDLTFADANPERGTVTAIVVILLYAASVKPRNRGDKTNVASHPNVYERKKYEALFAFEWTASREHCCVLYKNHLQELENIPDPWHPTESMEAVIKAHFNVFTSRKTLTNALAVHDWQSLDELVDASGIVTLFKDDGSTPKTERRLNDFNSLLFENHIDLASIPSVTDSEDDWGM